jgi:ribosomal protein S27AE
MIKPMPAAWLCLQKDPDDYVASREGYSEELGATYTWDDRVPNHASLKAGDYILLWNSKELLGLSVIERIDQHEKTKVLQRCKQCGDTDIRLRKHKDPPYKCGKCKLEFHSLHKETITVTSYTAAYAAAWTPIEGVGAEQCRSLALKQQSQHSLRQVDEHKLDSLLNKLPARVLGPIQRRATEMPNGHRETVVRMRVGQTIFRKQLIKRFGHRCSFTGEAPPIALQAAHLYRYSELGRHEEDGGLLMRSDIHRLFDEGLLAIDPVSHHIDVDPEIRKYPIYSALHGMPLQHSLEPGHVAWLRVHWDQYRSR